jgi:hypothetical protein
MTRTCLALMIVWSASLSFAGEVLFTTKPTGVKAEDKVNIAFVVSAPTDVEVAIVDSADKVVCHLAAGVLGGKNAPPEPLQAGLAQEVVWDGRDDFGKPAGAGPFKARVRAGMKPVFDGFIGASPYALGSNRHGAGTVRSLVVDSQGNLYVLAQAYDTRSRGLLIFGSMIGPASTCGRSCHTRPI